MNKKSDEMWMAYIDSELSASEMTEFDAALSSQERQRLLAELKFETALGRKLDGIKCPEQLWEKVKKNISVLEKEKNRKSIPISYRKLLTIVSTLAASILLIFALTFYLLKSEVDVLSIPTTVKTLTREVNTIGNKQNVQQLLTKSGIPLKFQGIPKDMHHDLKLLGAYETTVDGVKAVAVCFDCCGKPLRVVINNRKTSLAKKIINKCKGGDIQKIKCVNNTQIAVIGTHPGDEVLSLFI